MGSIFPPLKTFMTDKVIILRRPGHDYQTAPNFSFLIKHPELGRTVLFDLGLRKD